jgi:ammonium transporter Rh
MKNCRKFSLALLALLLAAGGIANAAEMPGTTLTALTDVQKYERAIHIMAMLLVGFGFLMVFVRKYGRSALTATYLLVSVSLPLYFLKESFWGLGSNEAVIDKLILAEFAAASLLICAGAVLGRLKMHQYLLLGLIFIRGFFCARHPIALKSPTGQCVGLLL